MSQVRKAVLAVVVQGILTTARRAECNYCRRAAVAPAEPGQPQQRHMRATETRGWNIASTSTGQSAIRSMALEIIRANSSRSSEGRRTSSATQQRLPPRKKGRNPQQTHPATPHLRRRQQLTPMTGRGDAYFLEVIGGQIGQQSGIDVILAECRLVAF
jgi:hypothetical protein